MYENQIQNLIDATIAQEDSGREKKDKTSWWPSELGQCLTGAFHKRMGLEPEPFEPRVLRVFKAGKIYEDYVMDSMEGHGVKIERQVGFSIPEFDLTGKADGVAEANNQKEVLEVKSCHSMKFWRMQKEGRSGDYHHRMQTWCAMRALDIARGRIIYVSKDDLTIAEYPVELEDVELAESVRNEIEILKAAWELKTPPPLVETIVQNEVTGKYEVNWKAKYCNFHKYCTGNENWLAEAEREVLKLNGGKTTRLSRTRV